MLNDKVAVITGGTRGIGFATVKKFLENGCKVVLFGSKKESVDKALEELKEIDNDYDVMGLYPNISNLEEVEKAYKIVIEKYGKIDILINNAGISARESIYEYKEEDFKKIMDLNVNAVFNCTRAVVSYMKENNGGVILNTSSMVSLYGQSAGCGYPASKFAVNGLTKSLARELGKDNIRVNAVAPGVIMTDMMSSFSEDDVNALKEDTPLMKLGYPEDVAAMVLFLASEKADFITGQIIGINGGFVI